MEEHVPAIDAIEMVPETSLTGELTAATPVVVTTLDTAAAWPSVLAAQPSMTAVPDVATVSTVHQPEPVPHLELQQQMSVETAPAAAAEVYTNGSVESAPQVATAYSADEFMSMGEPTPPPPPPPSSYAHTSHCFPPPCPTQ